MRRRSLLAALVPLVTGCVHQETDDRERDDGDVSQDVEFRKNVSIASSDQTPESPFSLRPEMTNGSPSHENPPAVKVEATNDADEALVMSPGPMPVGAFEVLSSDEDIDKSIPLVACRGEADFHQETDCLSCRALLKGEEWRVVESGETLTETRDLARRESPVDEGETDVEDERLESCYPTGTYRYENQYEVYEAVEEDEGGDGSLGPGDEVTQFTWGFEIEITAEDESESA